MNEFLKNVSTYKRGNEALGEGSLKRRKTELPRPVKFPEIDPYLKRHLINIENLNYSSYLRLAYYERDGENLYIIRYIIPPPEKALRENKVFDWAEKIYQFFVPVLHPDKNFNFSIKGKGSVVRSFGYFSDEDKIGSFGIIGTSLLGIQARLKDLPYKEWHEKAEENESSSSTQEKGESPKSKNPMDIRHLLNISPDQDSLIIGTFELSLKSYSMMNIAAMLNSDEPIDLIQKQIIGNIKKYEDMCKLYGNKFKDLQEKRKLYLFSQKSLSINGSNHCVYHTFTIIKERVLKEIKNKNYIVFERYLNAVKERYPITRYALELKGIARSALKNFNNDVFVLHKVAQDRGYDRVIQLLLEVGFDLMERKNERNGVVTYAWVVAIDHRQHQNLSVMLSHAKELEDNQRKEFLEGILIYAIIRNDPESVSIILEEFPELIIEERDYNGDSAIICAIKQFAEPEWRALGAEEENIKLIRTLLLKQQHPRFTLLEYINALCYSDPERKNKLINEMKKIDSTLSSEENDDETQYKRYRECLSKETERLELALKSLDVKLAAVNRAQYEQSPDVTYSQNVFKFGI